MTQPIFTQVLLANGLPDQGWASMSRYAGAVARSLAELPDFSTSLAWPPDRGPGMARSRLNNLVRRYVVYVGRVARSKADVVHILDHSYAFLRHAAGSKPVVTTCFDLAALRGWWQGSRAAWAFVRLMTFTGLRRSDRIVTSSQFTKDDVGRFLGVPDERIVVAHLGIDPAFHVRPDREKLRIRLMELAQIDSLHDPKLLLHVGSNDQRKNIPALLHLVARLRHEHRHNVHLIKVGANIDLSYSTLVADLKIQDVVHDLGNISEDALVDTYNACDLLAFPSLLEGFGWPVVEAMACGLPVVSARSGSLPELLGDAGLGFEPDDFESFVSASVRLIESPTLARQLADRGVAQAGRFSWAHHSQKLVSCYEDVCSSRERIRAR